jgi:hypothetical protein
MNSGLDLQLQKAGFAVGWDPEISAAAATFTWEHPEDGNKRKLVITRDEGDGVPEDPDQPVEMGLYELDPERGSWTVLVQETFPDVASAFNVIDQSPWNV